MGYYDTYCCFCGGPLDDAHSGWLGQLGEPDDPWPPKEGWMQNPPGFPVPTKSREEIVTITERDGAFWGDWVVVGPYWKESEYVSPSCSDGKNGIPLIGKDEDDMWYDESGPFLCIHRICLSIVCRSLDITPKEIWEAFNGDGAAFTRLPERPSPASGLLKSVKYYDIEERQGQSFEYARERYSKKEDGSEVMWYDPASMDDCQWLLARPTAFPKLEKLSTAHTMHTRASMTPPLFRVFAISEIFDRCLAFLKSPLIPITNSTNCTPHPDALSAILALSECSRALHTLILGHQDFFYQLALDSAWMLPLCPADWTEWKAQGNPVPLPALSECGEWDWRGYLLVCARGKNPHMRNRARFRRMVVQFALPTKFIADDDTEGTWCVGTLGGKIKLSEPEQRPWEVLGA